MAEEELEQTAEAEPMPETYVVHGALTMCDCGSRPGILIVPKSHGVYLKNKAQLNRRDGKCGGVNINSMGVCSVGAAAIFPDKESREKKGFLQKVKDFFAPKKSKEELKDIAESAIEECIPDTRGVWLNVKNETRIGDDDKEALLSTSIIHCKKGGTISIVFDGQDDIDYMQILNPPTEAEQEAALAQMEAEMQKSQGDENSFDEFKVEGALSVVGTPLALFEAVYDGVESGETAKEIGKRAIDYAIQAFAVESDYILDKTGFKDEFENFHYDARADLNSDSPTIIEAFKSPDWRLLPREQSKFHDNEDKYPELKFVNKDGREAVYTGDIHENILQETIESIESIESVEERNYDAFKNYELVTDPRYVGTYNYINPGETPENKRDVIGWIEYAGGMGGHAFKDVLPYYAADRKNTRDQDEFDDQSEGSLKKRD